MNHNELIRYSPFRIRECTDADNQFPAQVEQTALGYLLVRPAQQMEAKPLGLSPSKPEDGKGNEESKTTN